MSAAPLLFVYRTAILAASRVFSMLFDDGSSCFPLFINGAACFVYYNNCVVAIMRVCRKEKVRVRWQ